MPLTASVYPSEGRLASALANHFGQGFDANFVDDFLPEKLDSDDPPATQSLPTPSRRSQLRDDHADSLRSDFNAAAPDDTMLSSDDESIEALDEEESPFSGGFTRRLARQFASGEEEWDDRDEEQQPLPARPLSLRSLQWIRKNMTSLRIIVSLQRVTPADPPESRPRKASGN